MKYSEFDAAEYLKTDEDIADYLTTVLGENDPQLLIAALGDIARAKGMAHVSDTTGLNRESLYKALRPGAKPRFETIYKIISGMNIKLQAVASQV